MNKPYKIRSLVFKKGVLSKTAAVPNNGDEYLTILKYALQLLHVPYLDECCPDEVTDTAPVRFNATTGVTEAFDPVTGTWVDTAAP